MSRYSTEFTRQAVCKILPPNVQSVAQINRDVVVAEQALDNWRDRYRQQGDSVRADPPKSARWSGENKLAVVIEAAPEFHIIDSRLDCQCSILQPNCPLIARCK